MRTTCARGERLNATTLPFHDRAAVCVVCLDGLRNHHARDAPAHVPIRHLLLCAVCRIGDRLQLDNEVYFSIKFPEGTKAVVAPTAIGRREISGHPAPKIIGSAAP